MKKLTVYCLPNRHRTLPTMVSTDPTPVRCQLPYEKCYGVAAKGGNDCAAGSHSCDGTATKDKDGASFV